MRLSFVEGYVTIAVTKRKGPPARSVPLSVFLRNFGRGERIRTSDLTVPNRALYQAEPRPEALKKVNSY